MPSRKLTSSESHRFFFGFKAKMSVERLVRSAGLEKRELLSRLSSSVKRLVRSAGLEKRELLSRLSSSVERVVRSAGVAEMRKVTLSWQDVCLNIELKLALVLS